MAYDCCGPIQFKTSPYVWHWSRAQDLNLVRLPFHRQPCVVHHPGVAAREEEWSWMSSSYPLAATGHYLLIV